MENTQKDKKEDITEVRLSTNSLMAVFLAIVFAVGAFQTLQLMELSNKLSEQETTIANLTESGLSTPTGAVTAATQQPTQSAPSVPSNLQNLPNMVGGC